MVEGLGRGGCCCGGAARGENGFGEGCCGGGSRGRACGSGRIRGVGRRAFRGGIRVVCAAGVSRGSRAVAGGGSLHLGFNSCRDIVDFWLYELALSFMFFIQLKYFKNIKYFT
jgi:hypothetical protein